MSRQDPKLSPQADSPGGPRNLDHKAFDPGDPAKTSQGRQGLNFSMQGRHSANFLGVNRPILPARP